MCRSVRYASFLSRKVKDTCAPVIGFFEVFIWVVIISQILIRANDLVAYLSYAAGYASGNYVGILLERRIAWNHTVPHLHAENGMEMVQILNKMNFGATMTIPVKGRPIVDIIRNGYRSQPDEESRGDADRLRCQYFLCDRGCAYETEWHFCQKKNIPTRWRVGK